MKIRSLAFLLVLSTLLLALPAIAGEGTRKVTTTDGETHEGVILERGEAHIVLKLTDGRIIELQRSLIEVIEVLGGTGDRHESNRPESYDSDYERYDDRRDPRRGPSDENERVQPGAHLDGLDRVALKARLDQATGAHAFSIAPSIPSLAGGVILMVSSPLTTGSYLWPGQFILGLSLASGSIVTAAAGAHLASVAVGMRDVSERFRVGLIMAITGASLFIVPLGLTYGATTGFLPQTGAEGYYTPWLTGSGLGLMIAGTVTLMSDADASREAVEDRLYWTRHGSRGAIRPQFAGASIGPNSHGGMSANVSMRF
jgi:hypothetical protein